MKKIVFLTSMLMLICSPCAASLVQVGLTDFGSTAVHETFSEPIDYSNAINSPIEDKPGSMVLVGVSNAYTFSQTGVALTSPIPNTLADYHPQISVVNNKQYFNFGTYGELIPNLGSIPGGTGAKVLLEIGSSSVHFDPFILTFPGDGATMVGGNFIMSARYPGQPDQIVVTAYGLTGNLLGTAYISPCDASEWADSFYGFRSNDGSPIKSIGINYSDNPNTGNPGVANLTFVPVPEPSTIALLSLAGMIGLRLRRRKTPTNL